MWFLACFCVTLDIAILHLSIAVGLHSVLSFQLLLSRQEKPTNCVNTAADVLDKFLSWQTLMRIN